MRQTKMRPTTVILGIVFCVTHRLRSTAGDVFKGWVLMSLVGLFVLPLIWSDAAADVITDDPRLPPSVGIYLGNFHRYPGFDLSSPIHKPFVPPYDNIIDGDDEVERFQSSFSARPFGGPRVELLGPVEVRTYGKCPGGNCQETGSWQTEIVSMNLTGDIPNVGTVVIRQDPNRPSLGQTSVTDIGGGLFEVDSWFDVFTQISINGGQFMPSIGSTRMHLVIPEPSSFLLLSLSALGLSCRRRQR